MSASDHDLGPSEAAAKLGVSVKALRYYEKRGLLRPARSHAGWRVYGPDAMSRAAAIVSSQAMGLSLSDVAVLLAADEDAGRELLEGHLRKLERKAGSLAETIETVHKHLARREAAGEARPRVEPCDAFKLPWPWDGECFELASVRRLNFITGPLGCGKTRLAIALAEHLPGGRFLGLDRLDDGGAERMAALATDPECGARVERAMAQLVDAGATRSCALAVLLLALEEPATGVLVVDMVEQGLDAATQRALVAAVRQRPAKASPLFLMTRSNVILDMASVGPNEAVILCPANHGVPLWVAPTLGARGYEAVMTCLASPEVRARTSRTVARSTSFLTH